MNRLLTVVNEEMTISHRIVAENTANQEVSIRNLINKFIVDFEVFGMVHFKNEAIKNSKNKINEIKTYFLNEQQVYLLFTYLKNNEIVRNFKVALVKAFFEMREELYHIASKSFQGKSVLHTINGLKGGLAVKDRKINQLENRVQFLASENESLKIHRIKDNELMNSDIDNKTYTKDDVMKLIEKGLKYDELQEKYFVVATQRDLFNTYATDFIQQANKMKVETEKWEHMKDRLDAIKTNGVEKCKQTGWKAKGYPLYQN